jgi:thiol-disulfide isomerase/thioredoxin
MSRGPVVVPAVVLAFIRAARASIAAGAAWAAIAGAVAAAPTVEDALKFQPAQAGVDYDRPDAAAAKQATIAMEKEGGVNAYVVRGAGGEVLRAFADTNADRLVDRYSYYKDGLEVYRDIDSNHDKKIDQSRWLNAGGSRWAEDADGDGRVDAWKQLSAEEATAEIVAAVRNKDAAAFTRLLPTKADLEAAGFEAARLDELAARVAAAAKGFAAVAAQAKLGADARWMNMLSPQPPGVIPAGSAGVGKDVAAYDNVVALVEGGGGGGQVFVGSLVKCGEVWRPIDAPQLAGESGAIGESFAFFTPRTGSRTAGPAGPPEDERLKPLMAKLRDIEAKLSAADPAGRGQLAAQQAAVLEQVLAAAAPADKPFWVRQVAETLAALVQEGALDDGIGRLDKLAAAVADDTALAAFVAFRLAQARYAANMQKKDADIDRVQAAWLAELAKFVEAYPEAPDAAEAMLQMGIADEFSGREKEALERYAAIAKGFPESAAAKKARGAARRLESVGKPLTLAGTTPDGRKVSLDALRGTPVLVHYWATWCEPCKVDIAQIRELYAKFGAKKLAVVGIALDTDAQQLAKYLQAKPMPWPQLHEPGGLDGRLAEELGVLTLPTMLLLDAEGKVVDRNVAITDLERKLDALVGGR